MGTFRIEIRFDFNDTHVNTHLNTTRKMFSLTQSASFCAGAKVNVAAQKKATIQNLEIHPSGQSDQLGIFIQERLPLRRGVVLRVPLRRRRQRGDEESEKVFILLHCSG